MGGCPKASWQDLRIRATQSGHVRVHQREGGVVADGADVAEMIGEAFQFGRCTAGRARVVRDRGASGGLCCTCKSQRVADSAVARDPSGEACGVRQSAPDH